MKEMIKMTLKEAERLSVMRQVDKKNLTLRKASEELGLSLRQTKRIRKRYKEGGVSIFFFIAWNKEVINYMVSHLGSNKRPPYHCRSHDFLPSS